MTEVLMDNFGLEWKIIGGDITYGDWAYNWDSGDVVGVIVTGKQFLMNKIKK